MGEGNAKIVGLNIRLHGKIQSIFFLQNYQQFFYAVKPDLFSQIRKSIAIIKL